MAIGKAVYGGNCANCHQGTGEGQPGSYPPLARSEWVIGEKDALYAIMLHGLQGPITVEGGAYGSQQMPGWSTTLNDEKIAAVMTLHPRLLGQHRRPVKPEEVSAARAKFAAKGDSGLHRGRAAQNLAEEIEAREDSAPPLLSRSCVFGSVGS